MTLPTLSILFASLALLASTSLLAAQRGAAVRKVEIGQGQGGFTGTLGSQELFGGGLAALGDIDGDGVGDLAVGAPGDDDGGEQRGALWILRLNADGTVKAHTKISQTSGGFTGALSDGARLGARIAPVGDLDLDGVPDVAAMAARVAHLLVFFLNPDGSVKAHARTVFNDPVFVPPASQFDFNGLRGFGGLEALGDMDGDGSADLAVGAPYDEDGPGIWTGALWILRMRPDGKIGATQKISMLHGGFTGTLEIGDLFGYSIAKLPDLDGDGNPEFGVGAAQADEFFWVLYLDANENVKGQQGFLEGAYGLRAQEFTPLPDLDGDGRRELAFGLGFRAGFLADDGTLRTWRDMRRASTVLASVPSGSDFGFRFADLGDLDGDGAAEVAVGLPSASEVWVLTIGTSATRNGSGVNTQMLTQASPPALGQTWDATLDCSGVGAGLAVLAGRALPVQGVLTVGGEILIGGTRYFLQSTNHVSGPTLFSAPVPLSTSLIDLPIFVQGACLGFSGPRLSNALDLLIDR